MNTTPFKTICSTGLGVLCTTILAAGLAAIGAGAFGLMMGTVFALIRSDPWQVEAMGLYCAACGAGAGALIGSFARAIDPHGVADLYQRSSFNPASMHAFRIERLALDLNGPKAGKAVPRVGTPSLN